MTIAWSPWVLDESNAGYDMGYRFIFERCWSDCYPKFRLLERVSLALIANIIIDERRHRVLLFITLVSISLETYGVLGFWGNVLRVLFLFNLSSCVNTTTRQN